MKNKIQSSFALLSAVAIFTAAFLTSAGFPVNEPQPELAIGAKAPLADAAMANVDGTMMTLESAAVPTVCSLYSAAIPAHLSSAMAAKATVGKGATMLPTKRRNVWA